MERKAKGFAIMLVLMMLFLLFMLGVAFFFSAWTHAFMARNYLNMKRAFVVAEGGVHHAISNIIGDFVWASHAQNREVNYRWKYGNPGIPVEYALAPSYAMPRAMMILGQKVGLSGVMDPGGGAYGINSDIFHLKVNECSAQLYVNEGLGHPYNTAVIQRILNRLEEQILGLNHGTGTLGKRLIQNRPISGYESKTELKAILGQLYEKVKDLICVHTWSDPKVANPVPLSEEASPAYDPELYQTRPGYPNNIICRYGRGRINDQHIYPLNREPLNFGEFVYAWQELNPCYIQITSRAPVNINTAPRQILIALLCDLQGFFIMQTFIRSDSWIEMFGEYSPLTFCDSSQQIYRFSSTYSGPGQPGQIGKIYKTPPITPDLAEQIAERIIARRPFYRWYDFNRFIDELVWELDKDDVLIDNTDWIYDGSWQSMVAKRYASLAIADVIKANFNPNLHLNELNPDANLWGWVDKTDLIKNSTEFCFLPTGYFEIESVGQILRTEWEPGRFHISPYLIIPKDSFEHNNQIMGQRRLKVTVKLWDLYRQTTQKDFMQGTYSHSLEVPYRTNLNLACLSGPEPLNGHPPFDNTYEGYVCLSTIGGSMSKVQPWVKGKLYRTQDFQDQANIIEEGAEGLITSECSTCGKTGKIPCKWCKEAGGYPCKCERYKIKLAKCQGGKWACKLISCEGCGDSKYVTCWKCNGERKLECSDCQGAGQIQKVNLRMHAHYDFDFRLHGCLSHDAPLTEAPVPPDAGGIWGVADWTERGYEDAYRAPYCHRYNPQRYRICRSRNDFDHKIAPTDLRVDGFYAEMYDYLPYYSRDDNFDRYQGTISYWIKPGFIPELDARIKFFSSISRGGGAIERMGLVGINNILKYITHAKFMHIFGWMNDMKEDDPVTFWAYIRPYSMYFEVYNPIVASELLGDIALEVGSVNTPTLNHVYHNYDGPGWNAHLPSENNIFMAHRWVHVALVWENEDDWQGRRNIFINGVCLPGTGYVYFYFNGHLTPDYSSTGRNVWGPRMNPFMLGSSKWSQRSASSTLDEFYVYGGFKEYLYKEQIPCTNPECMNGFVKCRYKCAGVCKDCPELLGCKGKGYRCTQCFSCRCSRCTKIKECEGKGYICRSPSKCLWCRLKFAKRCYGGPCLKKGACSTKNYRCKRTRCYRCRGWCPFCRPLGACQERQRRCRPCWSCTIKCTPCKQLTECKQRGFRCTLCPTCQGKRFVIREEKRISPPPEAMFRYRWGRYYRENDAVFASRTIELRAMHKMKAARPNPLRDPYGDGRWRDEGLRVQTSRWLKETWSPQVEVLGLSWTGYTEGIRDYSQPDNPLLAVQLEVSLEVKDAQDNWVQVAGPFLGLEAGWAPVFVKLPKAKIRYRVRLNTRCDPENAILLETPVLDDLTIYYTDSPRWINWVEGY
jgi:hypothetical protein